MPSKVTINIDDTNKILLKRNLNKDGKAQQFFTSEVKRLSDPYTPKDNGPLKNTAIVGVDTITYIVPYAKVMWNGKVMAGNPREPTDKDINYQDAPMRGKEWTNRMWADRGQEIVKSVAAFTGGISK